MQYLKVEEFALNKLRNELDKRLFYHGIHHTFDVLLACQRIGMSEGISDDEMILLKTAALFHDMGFVVRYKGHEEESCKIAGSVLSGFGYSKSEISQICEMIMATQIPQSPQSHLGEIICDADLDYLGRHDFEPISLSLYNELIAYHFITNEEQWNRIQLNFLGLHRYFTKTAVFTREEKKQFQLVRIKEIVSTYS